MCAADSIRHLLPVSPMSYHFSTPCSSTSSLWRKPHSTMSSPEFSDSKDEEDMDVDQDENSPQSESYLQLSSALMSRSRSLTMFSLSDLHISEQNNKVAASCNKPVLSKRAHSFQLLPAERTSLCCSNSARQSLCALINEPDDSNCDLSDVTQVLSPDVTRKEQSLVSLDEMKKGSQADGTLTTASLPQGQCKPLCTAKSLAFSITILLIVLSVLFSYVQQPPATQCVDHINVVSLQLELQQRVHGQHIAVNVVIRKIEEFIRASNRKLLVMSFHGWTGIGKNFMSSIIAQHLPSTNVHKFIVPLHFVYDTNDDASLLSEWIVSNVSSPSCGIHLFIIDEVDKAPSSLVHSLHKTLSKLSVQSNTICRTIFLLLTNDGATQINTVVTEALINGYSREDIELVNLIPNLNSEWYTTLMSAELIDQTVPFLPLERRHVVQCTEAELKLRQVPVTQQLIDSVVNSYSYFPADVSLFSSSGCRRITHLVDLFFVT